ncbi:glycosyltransferase family 2 protein [Tumebacillus sp. ITR2]|uniref:Glycosyltransferase family 2 protein n=1 Tax=Tumebacillus amylolyticus TaxID=2801339 RepID=A0ABS1JCM9_9BACL|nr:glycosyltransferase family 2 protein [Tumebacillus amylolyticus]MBL0388016.1 glycosyltransferase family 2 protein [Tumebacillus amylolyticus]
MITISLCLIVKNEALTLPRCLDSIHDLVDELIILDTGSTDSTVEIAATYTHRVYHFPWIDDFAAARNAAFSYATQDYILWLDADDQLLEPDRAKLRHLKQTLDPVIDFVSCPYVLGTDDHGQVLSSCRRNRLLKRGKNFRWHGAVHEYLAVDGTHLESDLTVTHYRMHGDTDRNLRIYQKKLAQGDPFSPRDLYYYGTELLHHNLYPQAVSAFEDFLNSDECWFEDAIAACWKLADCFAQLREPERQHAALLRAFDYGPPRAEVCCRLGDFELQRNNWEKAAKWFEQATTLPLSTSQWGVLHRPYYTWLPHVQLCICYFQIGDLDHAYLHNQIARAYRPQDQRLLANKRLLEQTQDAKKT